jgi:uncharacterized protein
LWKNGQRFEVESNYLIANKEKTALIKPENYVTAEIGLLTLKILLRN